TSRWWTFATFASGASSGSSPARRTCRAACSSSGSTRRRTTTRARSTRRSASSCIVRAASARPWRPTCSARWDSRASPTSRSASPAGRRPAARSSASPRIASRSHIKELSMKAAVFHGPQKPLTIENVDVAQPIEREVLVRTVASGVCHSDLHFVDGYYQFPTPAILGHEAAGIVEAVGPHVTEFKPGDHVIACLSVFCGHCSYCLTGRTHLCQSRPVRKPQEPPKRTWHGAPLNQFANLS